VKYVEYKSDRDNLLILIRFILDKVGYLFTYDDRKVFLFLLICYYLGEKSNTTLIKL